MALLAWLLRCLVVVDVENVLLRQQLALYERSRPRPRLGRADRVRLAISAALCPTWRELIVVVKPRTVVRWHRPLWRLVWTWRSRKRRGRPPIDGTIVALIEQMAVDHPTWGAPRIHGELRKLGLNASQSSVSRWMPTRSYSPSGKWSTFLKNEIDGVVAMDFFAIPTAKMKLVWGVVIIELERRRLVHTAITDTLTGDWLRRQLLEAFPFGEAPARLVRDNDPIFGNWMKPFLKAMGTEQLVTALRTPTMNAFAERVIGSIRRELFDHVIVLDDAHAARLLATYRRYYNESRTHLSLAKDSPLGRVHQTAADGDTIVALPVLGGLHARYERRKE